MKTKLTLVVALLLVLVAVLCAETAQAKEKDAEMITISKARSGSLTRFNDKGSKRRKSLNQEMI